MKDSPRILILRLSSLGDILHAAPALRMLRASFPSARIDWLVERRFVFLVESIPGVDAILSLDTRALRRRASGEGAWRDTLHTIRTIRRNQYDWAIDFQGLLKTAFLGIASGARTRIGFSRALVRERPAQWFYHRTLPRPEHALHVVRLNQLLAALTGAQLTEIRPVELMVQDADRREIDTLLESAGLREYAIINPGGGWPTKRWGPERYGELAWRMDRELALPCAVTTGPNEEPLYQRIVAAARGARVRHFPVSFIQLAPLILRSRVVIGGDTGPYHLACALGHPVVGIFGPTSPVRNGPWNAADETVVRVLACSFCNGRRCPTCTECMDIPVEEVFDAVRRRLARQARSKP